MRHLDSAATRLAIEQTRGELLAMLEHISGDRLQVPERDTLNPPLWELGHVAWFQEFWCLRQGNAGIPSLLTNSDRLYNSSHVQHDSRWRLTMPNLTATHDYAAEVLERVVAKLAVTNDDDAALYFFRLAMFHEMMHAEAFAYSWQALGYPQPSGLPDPPILGDPEELILTGGVAAVGSRLEDGFLFDNEKWQQMIAVAPCKVSLQVVSNGQFRTFVDDGGYRNPRWWEPAYFSTLGRDAPIYWQRNGQQMRVRRFDRSEALNPSWPMMNLSAYEAQAYCAWAGGRLPSEAEWAWAAQNRPSFEWGQAVWEWTSTTFAPLPGFSPDPYVDYSAPWFGDHRVVRGASFATPRGLVDQRFRNFYRPHRHDPFIGFRVCWSVD